MIALSVGHFATGWAVAIAWAFVLFMPEGQYSVLIAQISRALMWILWPLSTWSSSHVGLGLGLFALIKGVESLLFAALASAAGMFRAAK